MTSTLTFNQILFDHSKSETKLPTKEVLAYNKDGQAAVGMLYYEPKTNSVFCKIRSCEKIMDNVRCYSFLDDYNTVHLEWQGFNELVVDKSRMENDYHVATVVVNRQTPFIKEIIKKGYCTEVEFKAWVQSIIEFYGIDKDYIKIC